jgi:hypothetical protein
MRYGCCRVARWHIFKPKILIWGKFLRDLQWKILIYFQAIGLFSGYLVHFAAIWYILWLHIWYIFSHFGVLYQENSGNPGLLFFVNFIFSLILCSDLFLGLPDFFRYKIPKPEKYTK